MEEENKNGSIMQEGDFSVPKGSIRGRYVEQQQNDKIHKNNGVKKLKLSLSSRDREILGSRNPVGFYEKILSNNTKNILSNRKKEEISSEQRDTLRALAESLGRFIELTKQST